ncbi:unnamed protein product [Prorocentrum cordatum]|uniref:Uncharacterized protein n=1 Tax=Prorocentrum cordatum TaxID=2364126 RepID=A0ABN9UVX5_9DINO|nr:unnamed protein product [Polarella glacialis]
MQSMCFAPVVGALYFQQQPRVGFGGSRIFLGASCGSTVPGRVRAPRAPRARGVVPACRASSAATRPSFLQHRIRAAIRAASPGEPGRQRTLGCVWPKSPRIPNARPEAEAARSVAVRMAGSGELEASLETVIADEAFGLADSTAHLRVNLKGRRSW